jgi:kynurenine formamidase
MRCFCAPAISATSVPRASGAGLLMTPSPECLSTLPWLHEQRVAALASDNSAVGLIGDGVNRAAIHLPVHAVAIVQMGLLLGENFDLDSLAEDCARDGVYEFLFVGSPLPFTGAVGAPVNPLAIK